MITMNFVQLKCLFQLKTNMKMACVYKELSNLIMKTLDNIL